MCVDLQSLFVKFNTEGNYLSGEPFGSGHIHDTYRIITSEKECDDYILQRINTNIFKNVPELQENISRVTSHIQSRLSGISDSNIKRECLSPVSVKNINQTWVRDDEGNYWRMFIFIADHKSYEHIDSPWQSFEAGKAIGRFGSLLSDLPGEPLHETIPYFHNIGKRLGSFHHVIKADPAGRVSAVKFEIEEIIRREEMMKTIVRLGDEGLIPLRITHNDTKLNNILFDFNDKALCVLDLDTVMPGYVHYDFGDAIRTAACTAEEDEEDLNKVSMDIGIFKAFSEGYLSETRETLNDTEKEYLSFAPALLTYTMATRFLTDFIDGDNYYKIRHPLHNLQRVRAQLKLLHSMESQYHEMQAIIKSLI